MRKPGFLLAALVALAAPATGCFDDGEPAAPTPQPEPEPEPEPQLAPLGYSLTSTLDIPAGALLPQPGYDAFQALRALRTNPGAAIFDILDQAGVPLLADLKSALPDVLESKVEGWIGDAIADHTDLAALDGLIALGDRTLANVGIESTLELSGATPTHRLSVLRFGRDDAHIGIDVPVNLLPDVIREREVALSFDANGDLVIGEHAYGLPIGEYAWIGVQLGVDELTGHSPRELLGEIVDCAQAANAVASQGAFGMTVGHEAQITELCEKGLDLIEAKLAEQVLALDVNALRFVGGRAHIDDSNSDGVIDRLENGTWDARIDAGLGERTVSGSFEGVLLVR